MKKFCKLLLGLAAAGAAGAGVYYWLKKQEDSEPEDEFSDDFEEEDFDLDDDLGDVSERGYVSLTPSADKDAVEEKEEAAEEKPEEAKEEATPKA